MGIYSGTIGYSRFQCQGFKKKLTIRQLDEFLETFKAPPLKIDGRPQIEATGWVRPLTPQDPEIVGDDAHWDMTDCQVEKGFLLRMRFEQRKIQTSLLQMLFRQKLLALTTKQDKPPTRLERQQLKEDLAQDLLKRTIPKISFVDLFWNVERSELFVFSASKTMCEKAVLLFSQTFGKDLNLQINKLTATSAWLSGEESEIRLMQIAAVEPSVFAQATL